MSWPAPLWTQTARQVSSSPFGGRLRKENSLPRQELSWGKRSREDDRQSKARLKRSGRSLSCLIQRTQIEMHALTVVFLSDPGGDRFLVRRERVCQCPLKDCVPTGAATKGSDQLKKLIGSGLWFGSSVEERPFTALVLPTTPRRTIPLIVRVGRTSSTLQVLRY